MSRCQLIPNWILWSGSWNYKMVLWSSRWSFLPPALPSLVHSHHRVFWSDLCSVLLSYFYNNINKLSLISNGHLLTDTTTLKGQNWPQCNPTQACGSFTETIRRRTSSASQTTTVKPLGVVPLQQLHKYCGSYWSQWDTTNFQPTTTEALKANFAPSPASLLQINLHSYLASKYQGLNLHLLLF